MGRAEAVPPQTRGQRGEQRQSVAGVSNYRRREPEKSLLHETVRGHLKTFLAEIEPALSTCPARAPCSSDGPDTSRTPPATKPPRPLDSRIPWNELLLRVFREDVLACPGGGRREVIGFIDERPVIERILGHLGLPTTGSPNAPAGLSALAEASLWQDDVSEPHQSLR